MKTKVTARTIGEYVHRKTMARMQDGDGTYWESFHQVLDADPELKALYAGLVTATVKGPQIKPSMASGQTAGAELDRLTRQFMRETNVDDYEWALRQIMKANPSLFKQYTQS